MGEMKFFTKILENSVGMAAFLFMVYYIVKYHLPAQQKAFIETGDRQAKAFKEAIELNQQQFNTTFSLVREHIKEDKDRQADIMNKIIETWEITNEVYKEKLEHLEESNQEIKDTVIKHHDLICDKLEEHCGNLAGIKKLNPYARSRNDL